MGLYKRCQNNNKHPVGHSKSSIAMEHMVPASGVGFLTRTFSFRTCPLACITKYDLLWAGSI